MNDATELPLHERLEHSRKFYALDVDDDVLLTRPSTNEAMRLDPAASVIWKLCDGSRTVGELIGELADSYPDQADDVRRDVMQTLSQLREKGALTPVRDTSSGD